MHLQAVVLILFTGFCCTLLKLEQSVLRRHKKSNAVSYQIKSWSLKIQSKIRKEKEQNDCDIKRHKAQSLLIKKSSDHNTEGDSLTVVTSILSEIEAVWTFEERHDPYIEDEVSRTGESIKEVFTFTEKDEKLRMLRVNKDFFSLLQRDDKFYNVALQGVKVDHEFLYPIYEVIEEEIDMNFDPSYVEDSDMQWYRDVKFLVQNEYFKQLTKNARITSTDNRTYVANLGEFYSDEEYVENMIKPNMPDFCNLNCDGITRVHQVKNFDRTGFLAFFGSGNHMIRF